MCLLNINCKLKPFLMAETGLTNHHSAFLYKKDLSSKPKFIYGLRDKQIPDMFTHYALVIDS